MLTVEVDNRSGAQVDEGAAVELAGRVLRAEGIDDGELGLAFVGSEEMRALKRDHLGIDEATDVLSFPIDGRDALPAGLPRALGDVVLCPAVVGEAWRSPLTHGLLHLLGYDHGDADGAPRAGARVSQRSPNLLDSFNYAFEGIIHVLRTQRNMRIHFAIAVLVLVLAVAADVTKLELIVLLLAIAFVLIAEMINTAIEGAIDVATSSFDPMAKLAKDIAAGAVLLASINAVAVGYLVFSGKTASRTARLIDRVRDAPAELTIVALVITVIVVLGVKAWTGSGAPLRGGLPSGHAAVAFAGWIALTYIAGAKPPLPDLDDRLHPRPARRADARRVGRPLRGRGRSRRPARGADDPGALPARRMSRLVG